MNGQNGSKKLAEVSRLGSELEKTNVRITQQTQWMRSLSNDLRRLADKLYGLTEGRVTLSDVKVPAGRYRTPDQTLLDSSEFVNGAERMVQVKRRFTSMEKDLAAADDLRDEIDASSRPASRRKAG
ncbi:MAG: hypothetical protein H0V09_09005 [Gemmatimonadetes bacterium]|nr:hypothetical protein [Gemmatimonadota bacterium]